VFQGNAVFTKEEYLLEFMVDCGGTSERVITFGGCNGIKCS